MFLGEEHPHTLMSIGHFATTYWQQGRRKEAEELALHVLEKQNRMLGVNHPDTSATAAWLAHMHESATSTRDSQAAVSRAQHYVSCVAS